MSHLSMLDSTRIVSVSFRNKTCHCWTKYLSTFRRLTRCVFERWTDCSLKGSQPIRTRGLSVPPPHIMVVTGVRCAQGVSMTYRTRRVIMFEFSIKWASELLGHSLIGELTGYFHISMTTTLMQTGDWPHCDYPLRLPAYNTTTKDILLAMTARLDEQDHMPKRTHQPPSCPSHTAFIGRVELRWHVCSPSMHLRHSQAGPSLCHVYCFHS